MTRVERLRFDAEVVTFDEPDHPDGLVVASTSPLTLAPTFAGYLRHPDGTYLWAPSTATWVLDEHPWALLRVREVDPMSRASRRGRPGWQGAELTITDGLESGRRARDPARVPTQPRRVHTAATVPNDPTHQMKVMIDDGANATTPSQVTVLDGAGRIPSGAWLLADPLLATDVLAGTSPVTSRVMAVEPTARRSVRAALGGDTLVFAPAADPSRPMDA